VAGTNYAQSAVLLPTALNLIDFDLYLPK